MSYRIREYKSEDKFCQQVTAEVITEVISREAIEASIRLAGVQEQRVRRLPALLTLLVCIGMNLWSEVSLHFVLVRLVRGSRLISGCGVEAIGSKGAISQARYRLGVKPLEYLFKQSCQPIATPETRGAFAFGLRLVALDGTTEEVADTPANAAYFGRPQGDRGAGAFPQVQVVYLVECGTHVIFDAGFWQLETSEQVGAKRLLRSVCEGMLLLVDRGLYSFDLVVTTHTQGAHVLARVSESLKPQRVELLEDGSCLADIQPGHPTRRRAGERYRVRVITYTLNDPQRPGYSERHRLLTTLLDPHAYPAHDLICLYHERWEIELTIDELDTHQRFLRRPLRSGKPIGVIQELYALLLAHFVVRFLMHRAACQAHLDPDRLSFTAAIRLIVDAIPDFQVLHPDHHPHLWQRLLHDLAVCTLPPRASRSNPRVVKRKMSKFKRKRPLHLHLPPLPPFAHTIVLLPALLPP